MHQLNKHRRAAASVKSAFERRENCLVVHYSCESFADRPQGRSPRITSIAVRYLESGRTESFSIHQVAEREGVAHEAIPERYDELERKMLEAFYDFVGKHPNYLWLHWNMRDINYGFPALAHRFSVLKGQPRDIPDERLLDVSRLLVALYGTRYMKHPRLENLIRLNDITELNLMTGKDEASAFDAKEYVKLHQSTLRKVDNIANIAERAAAGTLKTYSTWGDRYGLSFKEIVVTLQNHWVIVASVLVLTVVASVMSIMGVSIASLGSPQQPTPSAGPALK